MKIIKTLLITLLLISSAASQASAAFIVRSVKGSVTLTKGGKTVAVKSGMQLSPADKIDIPAGAVIEVTNDVNHNIYTSTKSGSFTVSRMMLDADVKASDNFSAINKRLKVGGSGLDKGQRVYVEQGMVKRSLSEYDPEASGFSIDPTTLARCIRERGVTNDTTGNPFRSRLVRDEIEGLTAEVTNHSTFPIYVNIIQKGTDGEYRLSSLGQPAGCYILLPRQTIMRNQPDASSCKDSQLMIVANCNFDVDLLLEEMNKQGVHNPDPLPEFPLYVLSF